MQMSEGLDNKGYGRTKFCEILESGEFGMDLLYMQNLSCSRNVTIDKKQHDS